jgi:hypothetical protein
MTIPARIPQAEIARAVKVARKAGAGVVRVDYANQRIDIILGGHEPAPAPQEEWPDDD